MKKIKLPLLGLVLLAFGTSNVRAQALEQGNVAINAYYGVNVFTSVFRSAYKQAETTTGGQQTDFTIKGMGPVGASFEYLATDKIGLGADLYYANTNISWKENTTNSSNQPVVYNYKVSVPRFGALFRANFHFAKSDNFDAYGIVAMGYKNLSFKYTTDDPDYQFAKISSLIPIGMKAGVGFRYFFTDNIGLNAEMAIGTPLLCGGLSVKF